MENEALVNIKKGLYESALGKILEVGETTDSSNEEKAKAFDKIMSNVKVILDASIDLDRVFDENYANNEIINNMIKDDMKKGTH